MRRLEATWPNNASIMCLSRSVSVLFLDWPTTGTAFWHLSQRNLKYLLRMADWTSDSNDSLLLSLGMYRNSQWSATSSVLIHAYAHLDPSEITERQGSTGWGWDVRRIQSKLHIPCMTLRFMGALSTRTKCLLFILVRYMERTRRFTGTEILL